MFIDNLRASSSGEMRKYNKKEEEDFDTTRSFFSLFLSK